jgi:hypothetical protein
MSKRVIINIDGQQVDLPEELSSLKLTFALKDRKGIATNTGTRSEYSFNLPATKTNDSIFRRFWRAQEVTNSEQIYRPAFIEVDGLPYFQGKAQLISATAQGQIYGRRGKGYKVAFYGNNIDWVSELRDLRIYELPFSTHTLNAPTIQAALSNEYPTNDYTYHPIKVKDWAFFDKVQYLEFSPMLSFASIVDYIFNSLGYTIESNFFALPYFQRLWLPVLLPNKLGDDFNKDFLIFKGEALSLSVASIIEANPINFAQTQAPAVGANPYALGLYTVPYDGFYRLRTRANLFNITNFLGLEIIPTLIRSGVQIPLQRIGDPTFNVYTLDKDFSTEIVGEFLAGDQIAIFVEYTIIGDADLNIFFDIDGEASIKSGIPIDFKYIIPKEWLALDFIKGISHAFNLVWDTNPRTRVISVEPSDRYQNKSKSPSVTTLENGFYLNQSSDFSSKIDLSKKAELKNITDLGEAIQLTWKYDGPTEEALNNGEDLGFFAARYLFPLDRFNKAAQIIENPFFAATLAIFDDTIKVQTSLNSPQLPIIWAGNYLEDPTSIEAPQEVAPRILYKEPYLDNGDRAFIRVDDGLGGFNEVLSPLAYMVSYNDTTGETISLSFSNITANGIEQKGLLDKHYLQALKRKEVGKELEEFIFWRLLDIQNLNFRNKILIDSARFILEEINSFNVLSSESSKTYLLYDSPIEEGDEDKIENSIVSNKLG